MALRHIIILQQDRAPVDPAFQQYGTWALIAAAVLIFLAFSIAIIVDRRRNHTPPRAGAAGHSSWRDRLRRKIGKGSQ